MEQVKEDTKNLQLVNNSELTSTEIINLVERLSKLTEDKQAIDSNKLVEIASLAQQLEQITQQQLGQLDNQQSHNPMNEQMSSNRVSSELNSTELFFNNSQSASSSRRPVNLSTLSKITFNQKL